MSTIRANYQDLPVPFGTFISQNILVNIHSALFQNLTDLNPSPMRFPQMNFAEFSE